MIPKLIHQIWCGPNKMPERERGFSQQLRNMHLDYEYRLWTDEFIEAELALMPVQCRLEYQRLYAEGNYAFCADVLRIWLVYEYGGFYLDVDFDPIKRLDEFLVFDAFYCYHPRSLADFTIVNGVFGAEYRREELQYCLEHIRLNGYWYGPEFFGRNIKANFRIDYEADQTVVDHIMKFKNIKYLDWEIFHAEHAHHLALYSWSDHYEPET